MAHTNSSAGDRSGRLRSRPRAPKSGVMNTLRPSRALVSWIDSAVSRLTNETPWTYGDDVPVAARANVAPRDVERARQSSTQSTAVPNDVRARFVRVGRDYYFDSGTRAFRDQGQKLQTRTENAEVIRSLVEIAKARGWHDITLTGTQRFRRDAWRFATVAGLVVRGYRPTEFEKQKFVRELAAARESPRMPEPIVDPPLGAASREPAREQSSSSPERSGSKLGARARPPEDPRVRQSATRASTPSKRERVYSGALLEHGPAPYEFHPQGEPSYYLRIRTEQGTKLLWGKDLERAIQDAKVQLGDDVHVRQTGRKSVTVKRKERDESGRVLDERRVQAHRNQWEIRRDGEEQTPGKGSDLGRALESSETDARASAREHPELQGALLALKGAQLFAEQRIADPAQRSAFVNAVREELVKVLDGGAAVPSPRMREEHQRVHPQLER